MLYCRKFFSNTKQSTGDSIDFSCLAKRCSVPAKTLHRISTFLFVSQLSTHVFFIWNAITHNLFTAIRRVETRQNISKGRSVNRRSSNCRRHHCQPRCSQENSTRTATRSCRTRKRAFHCCSPGVVRCRQMLLPLLLLLRVLLMLVCIANLVIKN